MPATSLTYLEKLLDSLGESLTPDAARSILDVRLDDPTRARIEELADKANRGLLTDPERAEYEDFIESADVLGILQAKARAALARKSA